MSTKSRNVEIPENSNNPIVQPLTKLFEQLNTLNGFLFHLNSHLCNHRRQIMDLINGGKLDLSRLTAGSSLVIRDLSEFPEDGWARYYPAGAFSTQGEEYIQIIDDLISRESAWTISQAYEAFESFLKNTTATFLNTSDNHKKYEAVFQNNLNNFRKKRGKSLNPTVVAYWIEFINYSYKKNDEIFGLLRMIAPELSRLEKRNNRTTDLTVWYTVITEVRHGITHSNRVIKNERIKGKWLQNEHSLLLKQINCVVNNHDYILNPTMKSATNILSLFGEYGFVIFKCLSKLENYDLSNILTDSNN